MCENLTICCRKKSKTFTLILSHKRFSFHLQHQPILCVAKRRKKISFEHFLSFGANNIWRFTHTSSSIICFIRNVQKICSSTRRLNLIFALREGSANARRTINFEAIWFYHSRVLFSAFIFSKHKENFCIDSSILCIHFGFACITRANFFLLQRKEKHSHRVCSSIFFFRFLLQLEIESLQICSHQI